ncbi:Hypothetical Protein FCC1311_004732 [Hondaea fermentalgiana]|uniref:Uncharacterized protein n=1 Tax=Hondaea fermentalgiana TaxID=2315210 RepID=A0A2R5G149_9STRA|nr:Hypothetical Protein FCC1311_004732 [Hondaea fermentalgiana]|eukprot:GBG24255.1 Hypothetical Protein FCC1311_004732 [Hondaea fermentalgiana]
MLSWTALLLGLVGVVLASALALAVATSRWLPGLQGYRWVWPTLADRSLLYSTPWYGFLPHLVRAPVVGDAEPSRLLHVHLSGTFSHPVFSSSFLESCAKRNGHHTIGLAYRYSFIPSGLVGKGIRELYADDEDAQAEAIRAFHETVVFGGPKTTLTQAVSEADSVEGRLRSALHHLASNYPREGWQYFLQEKKDAQGRCFVRWDRIVLSGHSQGGAHAAYLASVLPLRRVVLLSAPQSIPSITKSFVAQPMATKDVMAFAHEHEDQIDSIKDALNLLGVLKDSNVVNVDELCDWDASKFLTCKALFSTVPPGNKLRIRPEHASVAIDVVAPKVKGKSLYAQTVWPYLTSFAEDSKRE